MGFPIVLSTDENYIVPTYVAVHSLLRNIDAKTDVDIFILSSGIKEEEKKYFYELSNKIHFVEVEMKDLQLSINLPYISIATYYRFLIPEILKDYDKCLYLDSDIVVKGDITPLFDIPMEDYLLLGVRNYFSLEENFQFYKKRCMECNLDNLKHYVNAGVLVLNLKDIKETDLHSKMIEDAIDNFYPYNDQDVINKHCAERTKLISAKYNFMVPYLKNISATSKAINEDILQISQSPIIVHYSTRKKPWQFRGYLMANLWEEELKYVSSITLKEFIKPFIDKNRLARKGKEKLLDELKFVYRKYVSKDFVKTPQTKFRL